MDPTTHSAPIWRAPPEDKQVRATFTAIRARTNASCHGASRVQGHDRHSIVSPADLCGDGQPGGDTAGPWVSTASYRCRLWVR